MSVSVLLVGAGGVFGQPLLHELIRQIKSFRSVAILASNAEKAIKFEWAKQKGVEVVIGSFLEGSSYKGQSIIRLFVYYHHCISAHLLQGFTHVLCVVGNPVLCLQPAMIAAAIAAGVTHFYPSEWNSDISQKGLYAMRYFREKQVVRAYLAAQTKDHPSFKYTLFITGIFTEWSVLEFYGFDHDKLEVDAYGRPDARVGLTAIPE